MKKSGTIWPRAGAEVGASVDAVIAPQAYQVTTEVIAEGHHLRLKAPAQLVHEALVGRRRRGVHDPLLGDAQSVAAQAPGGQRLEGVASGPPGRAPPHRDGV